MHVGKRSGGEGVEVGRGCGLKDRRNNRRQEASRQLKSWPKEEETRDIGPCYERVGRALSAKLMSLSPPPSLKRQISTKAGHAPYDAIMREQHLRLVLLAYLRTAWGSQGGMGLQ
jgi:hypothetical protein